MAQVRPDIDLSALQRPEESSSVVRPPRSRLRIVVPLVIVAGFLTVLLWSIGDLWRGEIPVSVIRPRLREDLGGAVPSGMVLFQAAGWAEPEPFPVIVSALRSGVVKEMLVRESQVVGASDVVARLVDDQERIAVKSAEAEHQGALAEQARARAILSIVEREFEAAVQVTRDVELARADVDAKDAERTRRSRAVLKGNAELRIAEEELAVQRYLQEHNAAGPRQVDLAMVKVEVARADLEILEAEAALSAAEHQKALSERTRAEKVTLLRTEDRMALEEARAAVALADARARAAEADLEESRLSLDRTEVRAPAAGVVLQRLAAPGSVLADQAAQVCTLYSPEEMHIRVDVPQADVFKVSAGQKAEILAESRAGKPYHGEVIRLVQQADIQKVTLQVHVRVLDADALLRPEMLCQVRFLSTGGAPAGEGSGEPSQVVLVPSRLIDKDGSLWVIDAESARAKRKAVEARGRLGDWTEVVSGINISDKLIDRGREQLTEGARVRVEGDG